MSIKLKDWYGNDQLYDHDTLYLRDENDELVQFTRGTGGGSESADVCYVTFMSYDGSTEYGKKAVAIGDDCADPIARGIFDTPTKESTDQYNYTFSGWATEVNGAVDSKWNEAVTENKTVYAAFSSAVRYYTITYYDSDGTTVLNTESLAYGTTPSYTPSKDGVIFDGWTPLLTTVTGDTSYVVSWSEKLTFADATWADIARISESGKASEHFAIGDVRILDTTWIDYSGNVVNTTSPFEIVDFDYDTLADGTGKAGITIASKYAFQKNTFIGNAVTSLQSGYENTSIYTDMNTTGLSNFPTDLQSHIKEVLKSGIDGISFTAKVWIPSVHELAFTTSAYKHYQTQNNRIKISQDRTTIGTSAVKHMTRTRLSSSSHFNYYIGTDGIYYANSAEYDYCVVAFCI